VTGLTDAEIVALLCDCADEANSLACPGHSPSARHLWTEKSAAEILAAVERILADRLAPVEESKNRWRVRAKRAQNECSDLRSIVGTGNDLWTPADSAQAYLARAEAAEAHLAAHEAREARVRALADEWADEGDGLGASAALSDVANELRAALDGDA